RRRNAGLAANAVPGNERVQRPDSLLPDRPSGCWPTGSGGHPQGLRPVPRHRSWPRVPRRGRIRDALSWLIDVLIRGVAFGTPLLWGALGEIYTERAGIVNLGVEGMMILGAFFAFAVAQVSGHPVLGLAVAAVIGGSAALL